MQSLTIRAEDGRLMPMRFTDSQEIFWSHVAPKLNRHAPLWFIVLKARQVFSSTFTAALTFIRTLERGGANSLVVAHDLDTSHDLFNMAKRFYDHLPLPKIRPPKVKELEFSLPDGVSRYRVVSAGTMSKGRGTTQTCMHLSEVAFWPHPEVLTGMAQALPHLADTILVIESTANGVAGQGEMFHDLWQAAVRGESDYTPIFIPWWTMQKYRRQPAIPPDEWDAEERLLAEQFGVDGEQIQWRRRKIATDLRGVVDMFRQEFPASADESFVVSGIPAFDTLAVLAQRSSIRDPLWRGTFLDGKPATQDKGEVRVWTEPIASHEYVIGADTAEGVVDRGGTTSDRGGDYACAEVLDAATCEQVASVHGRIPPYEFAVLLNQLGRYYNRATLCIEVYPQGHRVQDHLIREFYYPNLHRWRGKPDRIRSAPARLYGWECVDPDAKVLTADLRWVPARLIKERDQLLACEEQPAPGRGFVNRLSRQTVTARREFIADTVEVTLVNGQRTRVSVNHPFWTRRPPMTHWQWRTAEELCPEDIVKYLPMWGELRTYDAGRLSAFLDGEGHLSRSVKHYGIHLLISQVEGPLAQEIHDLWRQLGFPTVMKLLRHRQRPQEQPLTVSGVIRLGEVLRALGSLRPSRLLSKFTAMDLAHLTIKSFESVAVREVRRLGEGVVIGLTTDPDHTLVVDGIVGHNTSVWSRPLMIGAGQRWINNKLLVIHEDGLLKELLHFSKNDDGKYEAQFGHDDRVMALLLALRSREENYVERHAMPVLSDPGFVGPMRGVRVADAGVFETTVGPNGKLTSSADASRRMHRILRDRARAAVNAYVTTGDKTWMTL